MDLTEVGDSDVYAEEERTFDFGVEEVQNNYDFDGHHSLLKDYGGEDFSKYLSDGDDGVEMEDTYRARIVAETNQQDMNELEEGHYYDTIQDVLSENYTQTYGVLPCQARQPDNQSNQNKVQQGQHRGSSRLSQIFKEQISKATNTIRSRVRKQSTQEQVPYAPACDNNPNKIYNFSFADSKMGYSLAALINEQQTSGDPVENADSGIGIESSADAPDVLDDLPGLQRSSWWSLGTLSSRLKTSPNSTVSSDSQLKVHSASMLTLGKAPQEGQGSRRASKNIGQVWKKVTNTISRKNPSKAELTIQTDEMQL